MRRFILYALAALIVLLAGAIVWHHQGNDISSVAIGSPPPASSKTNQGKPHEVPAAVAPPPTVVIESDIEKAKPPMPESKHPKPPTPLELARTFTQMVVEGDIQGTAFAISPHLLLTSLHVVTGSQRVSLTRDDGETYSGQVVSTDPDIDAALLYSSHPIPGFSELSVDDPGEVGNTVLVYGHPRGLGGTLSTGIISGLRLDNDGKLSRVQFTAPISPGSSGSPVLAENGKVIGMVASLLRDSQNLNFSIPSARLNQSFGKTLALWTHLSDLRHDLLSLRIPEDLIQSRSILAEIDAASAEPGVSPLILECKMAQWMQEQIATEISTHNLIGRWIAKVALKRFGSATGELPESDLNSLRSEMAALTRNGLWGSFGCWMDSCLSNDTFLGTQNPVAKEIQEVIQGIRGHRGVTPRSISSLYQKCLSNDCRTRSALLSLSLMQPSLVASAIDASSLATLWDVALADAYSTPFTTYEDAMDGPRLLFKTPAWIAVEDLAGYRRSVRAVIGRIEAAHGNAGEVWLELGFLDEFGIGGERSLDAAMVDYLNSLAYGDHDSAAGLIRTMNHMSWSGGPKTDLFKQVAHALDMEGPQSVGGAKMEYVKYLCLGHSGSIDIDAIYANARQIFEMEYCPSVKSNAHDVIKKLAELREPRACGLIAREVYNQGSTKEAAELFAIAADDGDPSSMCQLGYMYAFGEGVGKDIKRAGGYFAKAAHGGDPTGIYNFGLELENSGKSEEAVKLMEQGVAKGNSACALWLANHFEKSNPSFWALWLLKAMEMKCFDAVPIALKGFEKFQSAAPALIDRMTQYDCIICLAEGVATGNQLCRDIYEKGAKDSQSDPGRILSPLVAMATICLQQGSYVRNPAWEKAFEKLRIEMNKGNIFAAAALAKYLNHYNKDSESEVLDAAIKAAYHAMPKRYASSYAQALLLHLSEETMASKAASAQQTMKEVYAVLKTAAEGGATDCMVPFAVFSAYGLADRDVDREAARDYIERAGKAGDQRALEIMAFGYENGGLFERDAVRLRTVTESLASLPGLHQHAWTKRLRRMERSSTGNSATIGAHGGAPIPPEIAAIIRAIQGDLGALLKSPDDIRSLARLVGNDALQAYLLSGYPGSALGSDLEEESFYASDRTTLNGSRLVDLLADGLRGFRLCTPQLAKAYFYGIGVPKSPEQAYALLQRDADAGDYICRMLAIMLKAEVDGDVRRSSTSLTGIIDSKEFHSAMYSNSILRAEAGYLRGCLHLIAGENTRAGESFAVSAASKEFYAGATLALIPQDDLKGILSPEAIAHIIDDLFVSVLRADSHKDAYLLPSNEGKSLPRVPNILIERAIGDIPAGHDKAHEDRTLVTILVLLVSSDPSQSNRALDLLREAAPTDPRAGLVLGGCYLRGFRVQSDLALGSLTMRKANDVSGGRYGSLLADMGIAP